MHEMGIASSVLEAVHKELRRYPGQRATKVGLRIGEFAGVDAESLRFCFDVLARDSPLDPLALDIEMSRVDEGACGDELDLSYLELESESAREVAV
jgi:hydrogenase nickel incorporation protein HypA/HybF